MEVAKIVEEESDRPVEVKRTKAEMAFQKMQEKMVRKIENFLQIGLFEDKIL